MDLPAAVRLRPNRNSFEVEYAVRTEGPNFDDRAKDDPRMARVRHRSAPVPMKAIHTVGVLAGGALHLHPLASVQSMRPDMAYLDAAAAAEAAAAAAAGGDGKGAAGISALHRVGPQFRRVEDKATIAARRSTWGYLASQEDADDQVRLKPVALAARNPTAVASMQAMVTPPADPRGVQAQRAAQAQKAAARATPRSRRRGSSASSSSSTGAGMDVEGAEEATGETLNPEAAAVDGDDEMAGASDPVEAANGNSGSTSGPSVHPGRYLRALTGTTASAATGTASAQVAGSSVTVPVRGAGNTVTCTEPEELQAPASVAAAASAALGGGGGRGGPSARTGAPAMQTATSAFGLGSGGGSYLTAAGGALIVSPLGVIQPPAAGISMADLAGQPPAIQVEEVLRRASALPFSRLVEFAPSAGSPAELLDVTQKAARLVRGNWVLKTELALGLHWSLRIASAQKDIASGAGGSAHHGGGRGHSIAAQLGLKPPVHARLQSARDLLLSHMALAHEPTIDARRLSAATGLPLRLLKPLLESLCVRTSLGAAGPGGKGASTVPVPTGDVWAFKLPRDTAFEAAFPGLVEASRKAARKKEAQATRYFEGLGLPPLADVGPGGVVTGPHASRRARASSDADSSAAPDASGGGSGAGGGADGGEQLPDDVASARAMAKTPSGKGLLGASGGADGAKAGAKKAPGAAAGGSGGASGAAGAAAGAPSSSGPSAAAADLPKLPFTKAAADLRRSMSVDFQRRILMLLDDALRRKGVVSRCAIARAMLASADAPHVRELLTKAAALGGATLQALTSAAAAAVAARNHAGLPPRLCEAMDVFLLDVAARIPGGRVPSESFILRSPGDKVRNTVVRAFGERRTLRKADVTAAVRAALGPDAEVPPAAYTKLMHELATSGQGGAWNLRTGDEEPDAR